jgi:3-polyprenyl-4-hydroxybenzoate decarboxylase
MPHFRVRIGTREYLVEADGALHAMQVASVQYMLAKLVTLLPQDIQVDDWDEFEMEQALRDPAPASSQFTL